MKVKFCGITRIEDAREAARLGAWAIGLNHWADSPRRCDPGTAVEISAELRRAVEIVGVFVNASLDELARAAEDESLAMLQLHGDEGPAYCDEIARRTGCKVMKAVRVRDGSAVKGLKAFHVDYHLLDSYSPAVRGGSGERFDWRLVPKRWKMPLVLSGGLTPDNVAEGIEAVRPFAVDSASGTEAEPGRKDPAKLEAFFRAVEQADACLAA